MTAAVGGNLKRLALCMEGTEDIARESVCDGISEMLRQFDASDFAFDDASA